MSAVTGAGRRGRLIIGLAILFGAVVLLVLAGRPGPVRPLSPRSTAPEGTRGLVLFVEDLGGDVEVSRDRPDSNDDVALVLGDDLGDTRRQELQTWVAGGGVLVVADPGSPLTAPTLEGDFGDASFGLVDRGTCDVDAFADADLIDVTGTPDFDAPSRLFEVGDRSGCFGDGSEALITVEAVGDGVVVSVGDADLFTNQNLDERDNAVVAAALLVPTDEARVRIVEAPFQERDTTLVDFIPTNVRWAFIQVLIAFAIYALWRARRLGRPITEARPVEVAGSELVAAVGGLLEVSDAPDRAAEVLRADLRRDLGLRFGIGPGTHPRAAAEVVAARTGVDPALVLAALGPTPVTTDAELTQLAHLIDTVRREVFHGQRR